jgi:hypothetical protein
MEVMLIQEIILISQQLEKVGQVDGKLSTFLIGGFYVVYV